VKVAAKVCFISPELRITSLFPCTPVFLSHHKKRTFREEYIDILIKNEIEFDQQFLFDYWDYSL